MAIPFCDQAGWWRADLKGFRLLSSGGENGGAEKMKEMVSEIYGGYERRNIKQNWAVSRVLLVWVLPKRRENDERRRQGQGRTNTGVDDWRALAGAYTVGSACWRVDVPSDMVCAELCVGWLCGNLTRQNPSAGSHKKAFSQSTPQTICHAGHLRHLCQP